MVFIPSIHGFLQDSHPNNQDAHKETKAEAGHRDPGKIGEKEKERAEHDKNFEPEQAPQTVTWIKEIDNAVHTNPLKKSFCLKRKIKRTTNSTDE